MKEEKSIAVALIEAATMATVLIVTLYTQDEGFKDLVDRGIRQLRFRIRKARWLAWWNRQPGWRQELYEQKHGPQEV